MLKEIRKQDISYLILRKFAQEFHGHRQPSVPSGCLYQVMTAGFQSHMTKCPGNHWKVISTVSVSGGGQQAGDWERRGGRCTGGRRKGGGKAGFPRWQEVGEKGKNYAIFCNQKCKEKGANKYRVGTRIKGYGKREL